MSEDKNGSEFNEKFETIEEALKYIADSQAKSEWLRKKDQTESQDRMAEIEKHLTHITKVLRFNIEEYEFQEDKLQKAGEVLQRKKS